MIKVKCPICNVKAKFIKRNVLKAQFDDGTEIIAKTFLDYECPNCEMTIKISTDWNYYDKKEDEEE